MISLRLIEVSTASRMMASSCGDDVAAMIGVGNTVKKNSIAEFCLHERLHDRQK